MAPSAVSVQPLEVLARRPRRSDGPTAAVRERLMALVEQRRADAERARFLPPYVERLQEIRRLESDHRADLEHAYAALRARLGDDAAAFGREWRAIAAGWSFARVNRLIAEHNARYPVERSLPFDAAAGDYAAIGGRPYRRSRLDAAWVLRRFPAEGGA